MDRYLKMGGCAVDYWEEMMEDIIRRLQNDQKVKYLRVLS